MYTPYDILWHSPYIVLLDLRFHVADARYAVGGGGRRRRSSEEEVLVDRGSNIILSDNRLYAIIWSNRAPGPNMWLESKEYACDMWDQLCVNSLSIFWLCEGSKERRVG